MDLPLLHVRLLPELSSVDSQNALSTIMEFYVALPLTKEHILQVKKQENILMLMEFTDPTMSLTIQKQLQS